jgi:sphingosine kinase
MSREKVVFGGELCLVHSGKGLWRAILTENSLTWEEGGHRKSLSLDEVVGAFSKDNNGFVVNAYHLNRGRKRVLKQYNFTVKDYALSSSWVKAINNTIMGVSPQENSSPRRLHIIVNPLSGKRRAAKVLEQVLPLLNNSYLKLEVIETIDRHGYNQFLKTVTPENSDGLVVVGGDGTVYQLLNKLMGRRDWEKAIAIPLGIIPAGTSNGLVKSFLEEAGEVYDPINAAFLVAKGRKKRIDIVQVTQHQSPYYSLLSVAWGLVSEIDIKSDIFRFLGTLKTDVYFLTKLFKLPSYKGKISFLPVVNGEVEPRWQVIEDDFIVFWAMNVPWAAHNLKAAPSAQLCDGAMDIILIRKPLRKRDLLKAFLSLGTGKHLALSSVGYYKVSAFKLEAFNDKDILAIDGEQVPPLPIEVKVLRGVGTIFS